MYNCMPWHAFDILRKWKCYDELPLGLLTYAVLLIPCCILCIYVCTRVTLVVCVAQVFTHVNAFRRELALLLLVDCCGLTFRLQQLL